MEGKIKVVEILSKSVGERVVCNSPNGYRPGEVAEIVGWCFDSDRPCFTIRFDDFETTRIPASAEEFEEFGYKPVF